MSRLMSNRFLCGSFGDLVSEAASSTPQRTKCCLPHHMPATLLSSRRRNCSPSMASSDTCDLARAVHVESCLWCSVAKAGDTPRQSDTSKRDLARISSTRKGSCLQGNPDRGLAFVGPFADYATRTGTATSAFTSGDQARLVCSFPMSRANRCQKMPGHPVARCSGNDAPGLGARGGGGLASCGKLISRSRLRWPHLA